MTNTINMYNGRVLGIKVSDYGLENGYLDFNTLAEMVGNRVLNHYIFSALPLESWEQIHGAEDEYIDIYQFYIISPYGYSILEEYTDEVVYYNEKIDMYVWCITHFGTSWDYVLTDIPLVERTLAK